MTIHAVTEDRRTAAAFFRLEGTLLPLDVVATSAAALGQHSPLGGERLLRVGAALSARALTPVQPEVGLRLAWLSCRGMSEDRLAVLGALEAERLAERAAPVGLRLQREARARGLRIVWITSLIAELALPLAERLGPDEVLCDHLELAAGQATGRLREPLSVGLLGGSALRTWAAAQHIALERSLAYGSTADDQRLLAAVGLPCAVAPTRGLRQIARVAAWPTVEPSSLELR